MPYAHARPHLRATTPFRACAPTEHRLRPTGRQAPAAAGHDICADTAVYHAGGFIIERLPLAGISTATPTPHRFWRLWPCYRCRGYMRADARARRRDMRSPPQFGTGAPHAPAERYLHGLPHLPALACTPHHRHTYHRLPFHTFPAPGACQFGTFCLHRLGLLLLAHACLVWLQFCIQDGGTPLPVFR